MTAPERRDWDAIYLAIQNTVSERNRKDALVAADRLRDEGTTHETFARVADAYCWDPTTTTHDDLMNARAEWQTQIGLLKLKAQSS